MDSWRDQILREFIPDAAHLTLVADPDCLLLEERILIEMRKRGFELIPFEDHIIFRHTYESKFRSRWDQGEQVNLVVLLCSTTDNFINLPYDLLQDGRQISLNLRKIFPNLSYSAVAALDHVYLDVLYESQRAHLSKALGDRATKNFVLKHVFNITLDTILSPSGLLHTLLRKHHWEQRVPTLLDEYLIQTLRQQNLFEDWPLEIIVSDRKAFFTFLQERWPIFLDRQARQEVDMVSESEQAYNFKISGPLHLPFDHSDVRTYVSSLFTEGLLETVPHDQAELLSTTWLTIGIEMDDESHLIRRVDDLLDVLESNIPSESAQYRDWLYYAKTWAELIALAMSSGENLLDYARQRMESLEARINMVLIPWLLERYAGLINLPPIPPVMLHHIPRYLSHHIGRSVDNKVALVLLDGLALDQWIVIRKELAKRSANYYFQEETVFAWIPTITFVSRQAAFAGKPPICFPDSIDTTDKESLLWKQFWMDMGLMLSEISYIKGLGDGALGSVEEAVAQPRKRVVGLVVDKIDKIAHGMELGTAGMHNQVRQWAGEAFLAQLIDLLLENGFYVFLTSDHGNVEAIGCGRPAEGAIANWRGERARVYPNKKLRQNVKEKFPDALEWPPIGLPDNYLPLLAPARSAFVQESKRLVGHGGVSLQEIIVPFVGIERRST